MQFIDKVKLKLKAGNGGNGIVAFKREKYNPLGGPSGGDGGNGGSIIFKVDTNKSTLLDLRFSKMIRAQDGENGKSNNMYGASRDDVIVKVPLGTIVKDLDLDEVIADLNTLDSEEVILLVGFGAISRFLQGGEDISHGKRIAEVDLFFHLEGFLQHRGDSLDRCL